MNTVLRITVSLGVATALLVLLMVWGDVRPGDVSATLMSLSPATFLLAVGIHAAIYLLRAWRFVVLVPPGARPTYSRSLVVSAAHNLAAYVLPAKTGEAAFIVYLKATAGVAAARGLASLVVSRLLDLSVLFGGLALACAWLAARGSDAVPTARLFSLSLVLIVPTAFFAFLGARSHIVVPAFERLLRAFGAERYSIGRRLLGRTQEVGEALRSAGGERRLLGAALISLPLWIGVFLFYAVLARGMGLDGDFVQVTVGSSFAVMFNMLPVNGFAGFGTQEAGWTFGFEMLGIDRDTALATGIGAHIVQLLDVCLFGLVAHVVMGAAGRSSRPGESPDDSEQRVD